MKVLLLVAIAVFVLVSCGEAYKPKPTHRYSKPTTPEPTEKPTKRYSKHTTPEPTQKPTKRYSKHTTTTTPAPTTNKCDIQCDPPFIYDECMCFPEPCNGTIIVCVTCNPGCNCPPGTCLSDDGLDCLRKDCMTPSTPEPTPEPTPKPTKKPKHPHYS